MEILSQSPAPLREGRPCRVLIADDHPDSAEVIGLFLETIGCEIRIARDGLETFQAATTFLPDMACLDIGMPEIDGYEVARRIREQPWGKSIILIAISGWAADGDKERALKAGFDRHLTKPVDLDELKRVLTAGHVMKRPPQNSSSVTPPAEPAPGAPPESSA